MGTHPYKIIFYERKEKIFYSQYLYIFSITFANLALWGGFGPFRPI